MFRLLARGVAAIGLLVTLSTPALAQQPAESPRQAAIAAMYPVMIKAVETGNYAQARNICDQAIVWEPQNPVHHYNLACIEARAGGARLPFAIPALQRAAELGFTEIGTLKNDPDLEPVRRDPRFAEIERLVARHAETKARSAATETAGAHSAAPAPSAMPQSPRGLENVALLDKVEMPATPSFARGAPVGLFFMTRFWSFTGTLEKVVWYFAPDGTAYQHLENGFSLADLAAHSGPTGKVSVEGDKLEIAWASGKKSKGTLERSDTGFTWDGGIFTPVKPFDPSLAIAGTYEGGESLSFRGNRAAVSKTLELRPDGTFTWSGVSFLSSTTDMSRVTAGANGTDSTGRWHLSPFSIVLVDSKGQVYRRLAFPYDDAKTPINPDRIFIGGTMFKRR